MAEKAENDNKIKLDLLPEKQFTTLDQVITKKEINKLNTTKIGDKTEAIILAALLSLGKNVLLPYGNSHRYDMVVEINDGFSKIQCKTGRLKENATIEFNSCSIGTKTKKRRHYINDVDLFAIYCPQNHGIYIVPIANVGNGTGVLRLNKPNEKPDSRFMYAADFQVGKFTI